MPLSDIAVLWELARTRRLLARLRSPSDVARHRERLLGRQLPRLARTIPFYRGLADAPLSEWPVMDKAASLANFGALNARGVTTQAAWAAAEAGLSARNGSGSLHDLTVGTSTGTSGNRGLFLVSPAERRRWLGAILAKALPDFPRRRHRVALMLATANELYDRSGDSGRLTFAHYDLTLGVTPHRAAIEAFAPTVLIAPPKALRAMADDGFALRPAHVFSGAEVLDASDRACIEAWAGLRVREIYQATEGFLGISCAHGTVHLNEDAVAFEFEPVPGSGGAVTPLVTDLRRTTQAMVRYRMNDILRLGPACPCGSPLQAVACIEGRVDDAFDLPGTKGGRARVMPHALRLGILDASRGIDDFRAIQVGPAEVEVRLPATAPEGVEGAVTSAVSRLLESAGARASVSMARGIEVPFDRKLRRVERRWRG